MSKDDKICCVCDCPIGVNINIINKNKFITGKTILTCGHEFHVNCFHTYVNKYFEFCPACIKPEGGLLGDLMQNGTATSSLNFGDDILVDREVNSMKAVLNMLNITREKTTHQIKKSRVQNLLSDAKYKENNESFLKMGSKKVASNAYGFLSKVFEDTTDISDEYENVMQETNPFNMIKNKLPILEIINKKITPTDLYYSKVTIPLMFENGYNLDDLMIIGFTWLNMVMMGLSNLDFFIKYKKILQINKLVEFWKISFIQILSDTCGNNIDKFASIGFIKNDLILLKFSIKKIMSGDLKDLFNLRFNYKNIPSFVTISIKDWKELGLDIDILRKLKITSNIMINIIRISRVDFEKIYELSIGSLDIKERVIYTNNNNDRDRDINNEDNNNTNNFSIE